MKIKPQKLSFRASQRGATLMEMLISLAIGLAVVGAILIVYLNTSSTSRQSNSVTRMSEDATIGMTFLGNYLRVDGYSPPRVLVSPGSAIVGGVSVSPTDRNFTGLAIRGCDKGFVNIASTFETLACKTSGTTGEGAIAIRFEGDADSTIEVSGNPSDCLANAVTVNGTSSLDASAYKLIEARFFVGTGASGNPELSCAGNGGATAFTPRPLIQYTESLFLTYGVAADSESRNVTRYMTQSQIDALPGTDASRWGRVVSVKACMVMRSQDKLEDANGNYIDCSGNSVASTGGFARRAHSTVFTLRNRGDFASS